MQGRALLELGQPAEAAHALTQAYQRDKADLPTMRAAARACLQARDAAAAEPLLLRALTEADDPDEKLDILREYVPTLESLGKRDDALMRIG
jgi:predicted Zn-dependent protease